MLEGQAHRLLEKTPFWYARVALPVRRRDELRRFWRSLERRPRG
jgi:hypothetical protein